jgi:membrane fusion protein, heavy metal efflux system
MKQTVVMAAALSLGMLSGCSREKQDPAAQAPPPVQVESEGGVSLITVDRPERFPLVAANQYESTSTLNVTGSVNPDVSRTIPVISIASGRVVSIKTQLGAFVKKGELLMEVQSTDISNAFNQYLKAVNDERLARVQYDRAKILYDKGAIARSQLEIAENAEQDAQAGLIAAEQLLVVLGVDKYRQGLLPGNRRRHCPECHQRRRNRRHPRRIVHCVHHRRSLRGLGDLRRL